jgi:hypothetical protein
MEARKRYTAPKGSYYAIAINYQRSTKKKIQSWKWRRHHVTPW